MKSNHFIYIIILLFFIMIYSAYNFNDAINLCIWINWTCKNIPIPNLWWSFFVIFSFIISICMWFWRHFIIKEKNEEINKKEKIIWNKSLSIREKENFAKSLYSYIENHSKLDSSYIKWELENINTKIISEKLEQTKNDIKEKSAQVNDRDLVAE